MGKIQRELELNVAPEQAYNYIADIRRHPEWAGQKLKIEPASQGPLAVGSAFNCVGHQMGEHRTQLTVTELVPNEKLTFETEDDTGHFRHGFVIKKADGKTVLVKSVEPLEMRGPLKLMAPIATAFIMPRAMAADLKRIKAKLEG